MGRDDDRVWAELVQSFHAQPETDEQRWPAAENIEPDAEEVDDEEVDPAGEGQSPEHAEPAWRPVPDEHEHFVPPPPPPLPRGDAVTRLAWAGVVGSPLILVLFVLLGHSLPRLVGGLLAMAFIAGFVTLVARMKGHDPYDPDDGAVV